MSAPGNAHRDVLRARLRERRRAIEPRQRIAAAEALAEHLLPLTNSNVGGRVAGYWAMDGEIALHAWQTRLSRSVSYCLPVLHERGLLKFAPWSPGAPLVTNRYGIPEPQVSPRDLLAPEELDLVVLPLVAFDASGHRLGMGAGWYDRSFAFRQHHEAPPRLVGAAFAIQQVDVLQVEPWDVPLDAVCTESGVIECARGPR